VKGKPRSWWGVAGRVMEKGSKRPRDAMRSTQPHPSLSPKQQIPNSKIYRPLSVRAAGGGEGNFKTAMELMRSHLPSSRLVLVLVARLLPSSPRRRLTARSPRFTARSPATHREISREEERRKERACRGAAVRAARWMRARLVGMDHGWVE
jgi:hypothetical protein